MSKSNKNQHEALRKKVFSDPEALSEYYYFKAQLELAGALKKARVEANLTQEVVADRMETQKPVVARIEAAGGKAKHSPSLKTLLKYANAIGCDLKIRLVPRKGFKKAKRAAGG